MRRQVLSLFLTLFILISVGGVASIVGTADSHAQSVEQIKSVDSDKEKTAIAGCEPPFAASKKSDKYHCGSCPEVNKIKPANLIWFNTACDAQAAGYTPCSKCNPPGCSCPSPTPTPTPTPAPVPVPTPTPPILISTILLIQGPKNTVNVGDRVTMIGTLARPETMDGIAGAPITVKLSLDGKNWVTIDNKKTDNNGSIRYTITVPDPQSCGQKLPVVLGYKFSYDGSDTYAASDGVCTIKVVS